MGEAIGAALSFDAVFGQLIRDVDIPVSCLIGVDDVCFLSGSFFFRAVLVLVVCQLASTMGAAPWPTWGEYKVVGSPHWFCACPLAK